MSRVFVRFAPSPTGFLHIGGARTALTNILFARSKGGTCILRIDDTDKARSEDRFLKDILDSLNWLGLNFHETYKQSNREDVYESFISRLTESGSVFKETTDRGEALIFRPEKKDLFFEDMIRGKISLKSDEVTDIVIKKSDGTPTYIFASTVDDIDMGITHVVRGEDHISNTFKQLLLFQALSPDRIPRFAHLPLIHSEDGSRLSKRHGATSVTEFRNMGYLPEALINVLLLLGWSPGGDKEIIELEEACSLFSLEDMSKKASLFSYEKAAWINGQYIKNTSGEDLIERCRATGMEKIEKYAMENKEKLIRCFDLTKSRPRLLKDFEKAVGYFFEPDILLPDDLLEKYLPDREKTLSCLLQAKNALNELEEFTASPIETALRGLSKDLEIKAKDLLVPLRVVLSGQNVTPGIFDVIEVMGKDLCFKRILDYKLHLQ